MTTEEEREARIAKLPQWAQRDIDRLERNAKYWRDKATVGPAESNTYVQEFEDSKPLGNSPRIRFWLAPPGEGGAYIDAHIVESRGQWVLELHAEDTLELQPRSGNHAVARSARW